VILNVPLFLRHAIRRLGGTTCRAITSSTLRLPGMSDIPTGLPDPGGYGPVVPEGAEEGIHRCHCGRGVVFGPGEGDTLPRATPGSATRRPGRGRSHCPVSLRSWPTSKLSTRIGPGWVCSCQPASLLVNARKRARCTL